MSPIRFEVSKQLSILATILVLSWLLGTLLNLLTLTMVSALCGYIYWHGRQFILLYSWLLSGRKSSINEGLGPWYPITEAIYHWHSDTKKNKKKLLSVINEFRLSTDALYEAVVLIDIQSAIVWSNKSSKALLGFHKKKDVGTRITHLMRHPKFIQYWDNENFTDPLLLPSPISTDLWLSIQITPYSAGQKLLVARNVTRLNRLEQIRQDFVSNVSHELRSPLTVINGYLETLDGIDNITPKQLSHVVQQMLSQGKRMKHIVDELLYLARIENTQQPITTKKIAMNTLLASLKQEAQALSGESMHQISVHIQSNKSLLIHEKDAYKIFSNLVFNAVRYTSPGKCIDIKWEVKKDGGYFSVSDEGIGIAAQDISRLTERFYRVDPGRSRDAGGTGLGLAIVKHSLERYLSSLVITSELEKGSTFTCHFPKDLIR